MATPCDLRNLMANIDIRNLRPHWKNLGCQLGVSESDIEIIAYNCRNEPDQCTECMREVLKRRLKMALSLDWNDVDAAIRSVKSSIEADKRLEQHQLSIERGQKDFIAAINKVKISMDGFDARNEEIAENMADLKRQLEDEKASLTPSKIQWQKEDEEWLRGETERQQIRTAIQESNFKQSQFVKDFLRSKPLRDDLNDE